jgi:hypothetical protein
MKRSLLFALAALAACGGAADSASDAEDLVHPARHLYTLAHAPVPGAHATALVHLAKGFRANTGLNLVVHFHGWNNCIENDVEAVSSPCTRGGPVRIAHNLIRQLDASGANAALIAVERTYDAANSADGHLADPGFFRDMILELLPRISALAGRDYLEKDLNQIVLTSHSGGYVAVGDILEKGGLTEKVTEVILLDSLYGSIPQYENWLTANLGSVRMAIVYTDSAGTKANSQAFASRMETSSLDKRSVVDARDFANLDEASYDAPIFFYRSSLSHDGTVSYWFGRLLAHARLQ